jgi:hypothetical protein
MLFDNKQDRLRSQHTLTKREYRRHGRFLLMFVDTHGKGKRRFEVHSNDASEGASFAVKSLQTQKTLLYNYP